MNEMPEIRWDMTGAEVEQESFRRIEAEAGAHTFSDDEWRVVRRLIHTCADFSVMQAVTFDDDPIVAIRAAVHAGAPLYCDSNMIRSGISIARLQRINAVYTREAIRCHIADPDVASAAAGNRTTRALAALEKARPILNGAIVLIGNAPLALAGLARLIAERAVRPAAVIAMPVGFVHVVESKQMIRQTDVPRIVLQGRRGGSPLAVAALHGALSTES
jgi:precorrin-8X/cobalt-precorrin-8 methylmutase